MSVEPHDIASTPVQQQSALFMFYKQHITIKGLGGKILVAQVLQLPFCLDQGKASFLSALLKGGYVAAYWASARPCCGTCRSSGPKSAG